MICHIIPPHILKSIGENGNAVERTCAYNTISADMTMRAMRLAPLVREKRDIDDKIINVYSAGNTYELPGTMVRPDDAKPVKDKTVNEAYDGLNHDHDFLHSIFSRHSLDDEGLPLNAVVHFGRKYDNAFWDGQYMVFGDGDGIFFNRFTIALDVIGHELAHGMIEDESGLIYFNQAGALNESLADVFGIILKQHVLGQNVMQSDWLIGTGLFTKKVNGVALRSMKQPGTAYDDSVLGRDPQPAHMKNFVRTFEDNGGVHINSGIPNHAFYLLSTALGGNSWEHAGHIWYESLRSLKQKRNAGFLYFAKTTKTVAHRLFDYYTTQAVVDAWHQVGIKI